MQDPNASSPGRHANTTAASSSHLSAQDIPDARGTGGSISPSRERLSGLSVSVSSVGTEDDEVGDLLPTGRGEGEPIANPPVSAGEGFDIGSTPQTSTSTNETPPATTTERELFLAQLLLETQSELAASTSREAALKEENRQLTQQSELNETDALHKRGVMAAARATSSSTKAVPGSAATRATSPSTKSVPGSAAARATSPSTKAVPGSAAARATSPSTKAVPGSAATRAMSTSTKAAPGSAATRATSPSTKAVGSAAARDPLFFNPFKNPPKVLGGQNSGCFICRGPTATAGAGPSRRTSTPTARAGARPSLSRGAASSAGTKCRTTTPTTRADVGPSPICEPRVLFL